MKFINFLLIIFITINSPVKADLNQNSINELKQGGKLIFIRHAYAPGGGDPINFDISKCNTQRNLNDLGRKQADKIGSLFSFWGEVNYYILYFWIGLLILLFTDSKSIRPDSS